MTTRKTMYILTAVLLLGAGIRLIGISNPLIGHHSWRQTDTAAVARNFVEERFSIVHPRIDWRGTASGDVECEFPIYQFLLASAYRVLGVNEVIGRLLSVAFSLVAIVGVFLLSSRVANPKVGLWSAFFLAILPMPAFLGRTVMPESVLLACCVYTVLLFIRWTESGSLVSLASSATCLAIACLLKPPTLYLGLPLAYLAIQKHKCRTLLRLELWMYAVALLTVLALWYYHAHSIKQATGLTFGVWEYGSDKWGNWGLVRSWAFWEKIFIQRIPHVLLSYLGLPLLIVGMVKARHTKEETALSLWLVGMLVFIVIVAKGVFVHDYYLLPAAIPAAYFMGKAAAWGLGDSNPVQRWTQVCIALCIIATTGVSVSTYAKWLREEKPLESQAFQVANVGRKLIPQDSLVVAVDRGDPMILYYSHTKGWRSSPRDLTEIWVADRTREGAKYILGVHGDFERDDATSNLSRLLTQHHTVTNSGQFFIVSTEEAESEANKTNSAYAE